jgi:hypothetical protein
MANLLPTYKAHTRSVDDFIARVLKDGHLKKKKQQYLGTLYCPALYIVLLFKFSPLTAATAGR